MSALMKLVYATQGTYLVLDTETTGLHRPQICQIAIARSDGEVLLDTYVLPKDPIPADATRVHGITNAMVADAPRWSDIRDIVIDLMSAHPTLIYNAKYDRHALHTSDEVNGFARVDYKHLHKGGTTCVMEAFAEHYGDWNDYHGNYKWQPLSTAAHYASFQNPNPHGALGDVLTTLAVAQWLRKVTLEGKSA